MSDKNKTMSSLKNKFNSIERKMNSDSVADLKHSEQINRLTQKNLIIINLKN